MVAVVYTMNRDGNSITVIYTISSEDMLPVSNYGARDSSLLHRFEDGESFVSRAGVPASLNRRVVGGSFELFRFSISGEDRRKKKKEKRRKKRKRKTNRTG